MSTTLIVSQVLAAPQADPTAVTIIRLIGILAVVVGLGIIFWRWWNNRN